MNFPEDDIEYQDKIIKAVEENGGTFSITSEDGWSMYCGPDCPITPEAGMTARYYGRGIGTRVRGLFINGTKIWYRTEQEDEDQSEVDLYGQDAADWLARWDAGRGVWSISMGGLGPGYEQCIQIVAAEVLRWMLANKPDLESKWAAYDGAMGVAVNKIVEPLGLSGAQWGAGVNLAAFLYKDGPRKVMKDDRVKDRRIQVSRQFPGLAA